LLEKSFIFIYQSKSYVNLNEGEAWAWRIQQYLEYHQLHTKFYSSATFTAIETAVKQGKKQCPLHNFPFCHKGQT
jgi:hypothetical protein